MKREDDVIRGDKVIILRGEHKGARGIIVDLQGDKALVHTSSDQVLSPIDLLQNFSAAARKAWKTRPERSAGRKKSPDTVRKKMVSLRLEAELWDGLGEAAEAGLIRSREAIVNQWLREKLEDLWNEFDNTQRNNKET